MDIRNTCRHKFTPAPTSDLRFARVCRCGVEMPCSQEELHRFLEQCKEVRREYQREQRKAKSRESVKAFEKALQLKEQQITWLKSQILQEV